MEEGLSVTPPCGHDACAKRPTSTFTNNSRSSSKGLGGALTPKASSGYLCPPSTAQTPRTALTLPRARRALCATRFQESSFSRNAVTTHLGQLQILQGQNSFWFSLTLSNTGRFTWADVRLAPELPAYVCPASHPADAGGGSPVFMHAEALQLPALTFLPAQRVVSHSHLRSGRPGGESSHCSGGIVQVCKTLHSTRRSQNSFVTEKTKNVLMAELDVNIELT